MSAADPATAASSWDTWRERWHRYAWLVALISFGLGLASFLLVERREKVAQGLIVLLPLSWLAMLAEDWIERWERGRAALRFSPLALLRIGLQQVHQESFFFTLPFFLVTTNWRTPQAVFTVALVIAGLASMVDPLYHRHLAVRRWAYFGFHALAVFITVLTAAPMLWHLSTSQSLQLAALLMSLLSLPAAARAVQDRRPWHWPLLIAACALLGFGAWWLRWAIPPATLWVNEARVSLSLDVASREPGAAVQVVSADEAHREGIYVWTAIRAPRGLHEQVVHRWMLDGTEVDRVVLDITGGREQGYRAWSHKLGFPEDPRGAWEVQVVTEGGQLIGAVHLTIR